MNVSKRIVSLVLAFFLFVGMTAGNADAASARQMKEGIARVTASTLRLRAGASTDSATLSYAPKNDIVVVLEKTGDWYKVIYDLQTGYMHSSYLDVTTRENAELGYGRVNGDGVNIRSGPGTGYASVDKASKGERVYIIGINNQWFKVIFDDVIGYIRSDYVDLTEIPYENKASANTPKFFVNGKSNGVTPSPSALKGEGMAEKIVATAKQYIGVPYVWGGTTPSGFDCSGLVQYVFKKHGILLLRTTSQQYGQGKSVAKANLKLGDLVFFNTSGSGVSHVGIYIGNDRFIHASSSNGVMISSMSNSYWSARYLGARRVL